MPTARRTPPSPPPTLGWPILAIAACCLALTLGGCRAPILGASGSVRVESIDTDAVLRPDLRLRAYIAHDRNTADMYLTDLTRAQLDPATDASTIAGSIVHVHMFLHPRAGRTPIDRTASTVAIRHVVIARGEVGVYSGGGFMLPSGSSGDARFGGRIGKASLKLTRATDGFLDLLGPSEFSGSFAAQLDEDLARMIADLLDEAVAQTSPR